MGASFAGTGSLQQRVELLEMRRHEVSSEECLHSRQIRTRFVQKTTTMLILDGPMAQAQTQTNPIEALADLASDCPISGPPLQHERRSAPRYLQTIPVACTELNEEFQPISEFISAKTLNVSDKAILLATAQPLCSPMITVAFCDSDGFPAELTARVIRRERHGDLFVTAAEFIVNRS